MGDSFSSHSRTWLKSAVFSSSAFLPDPRATCRFDSIFKSPGWPTKVEPRTSSGMPLRIAAYTHMSIVWNKWYWVHSPQSWSPNVRFDHLGIVVLFSSRRATFCTDPSYLLKDHAQESEQALYQLWSHDLFALCPKHICRYQTALTTTSSPPASSNIEPYPWGWVGTEQKLSSARGAILLLLPIGAHRSGLKAIKIGEIFFYHITFCNLVQGLRAVWISETTKYVILQSHSRPAENSITVSRQSPWSLIQIFFCFFSIRSPKRGSESVSSSA